MTTNDFLRMLKVAAVQPNIGTGLAEVMADPNSTASSQGWLDYIKDRTNSVTQGLTGPAAALALEQDKRSNPDKWDFGKMRSVINRSAQAYADETRRWRKDNAGYFSNASWNPFTWGLMGRQVDVKGFSQRLNDLAARANNATDPVERAKLIAQHDAARKQWDKDYAHFMKRVDAPLHVARRADEWSGVSWIRDKGIQGATLGRKRGLADWAIGRNADGSTISSDDLAREYGQAVYNYTGDAEKAQSAERWLRGTGATAAVANNALELLATKGLSAKLQAAHKVQQAEKIYNAARVGNIAVKGTTKARLAATGIHAASEGLKSWRFWHAINPATAGLSDVITNGGKADVGALGTAVSGVSDLANAFGVSSPQYAATGTFVGGTMGTLFPRATKYVMSPSPWKAGWENTGKNMVSRGWNSVRQFASYNIQNPLKWRPTATGGNALVRGVKNTGSFLKYQFGTPAGTLAHAVAADAFKTGPITEVFELAQAVREGRAPSLTPLMGFKNSFMFGMGKSIGEGVMDKSDALAAMRHGGTFNDVIQEASDKISKDPAAKAGLIQDMGLSPDASDQEVLDSYMDNLGRMRHANAIQAAAGGADPASDPEGFRKELYNQYRSTVAQGGPVGSNIFYDSNLPASQREELLGLHIMAEDRRINGMPKGNPISQFVRGRDDVMLDTMRKSKSARDGVIAYGAGLLNDGLTGSGNISMTKEQSDRFRLIWNELNGDERRKLLSPLDTATAGQLMTMMNSGAMGAMDKSVASEATDMVFDRLSRDSKFRGEFIPAFMTRASGGTSMTPEMKQRALDFLRNTDPAAIMEGMGMEDFRKLARLMMSGGGSASGLLSELPEEQRTQLMQAFTKAAKHKVFSLAMANPIKNLPVLASLFAEYMGWNGVAEALENPAVFYGGAALLLGGGALLAGTLLGDDEDEDDDMKLLSGKHPRADARAMMKELDKQRELLANATVKA